jgi:hypothetical protein
MRRSAAASALTLVDLFSSCIQIMSIRGKCLEYEPFKNAAELTSAQYSEAGLVAKFFAVWLRGKGTKSLRAKKDPVLDAMWFEFKARCVSLSYGVPPEEPARFRLNFLRKRYREALFAQIKKSIVPKLATIAPTLDQLKDPDVLAALLEQKENQDDEKKCVKMDDAINVFEKAISTDVMSTDNIPADDVGRSSIMDFVIRSAAMLHAATLPASELHALDKIQLYSAILIKLDSVTCGIVQKLFNSKTCPYVPPDAPAAAAADEEEDGGD